VRAALAPAALPAADRRALWWISGCLAIAGGTLAGMGAHVALAAAALAVVGVVAVTRPGPFLLPCLALLPFEELFLKWAPEEIVYDAIRYGPELAIYALLAGTLARRVAARRRPLLRRTPADLPLLCFLAIAAISAFWNAAPPLLVAHGLRWMLRYVALYYLVVHLDWDERRRRRWLMILLGVALLEAAIGIIQSWVGEPAWRFLAPDYSKREWDFEEVKWDPNFRHGVFATMGTYYALGTYLAIWSILALSWRWATGKRRFLAALALLLGGLFLSYSRQAFLALLLAGVACAWAHRRRRIVAAWGLVAASYLGLGAYVYFADIPIPASNIDRPVHERFLGPFSRDYWIIDYTYGGRSYLLLEVGGRLLADAPLLGQGPGMYGTRASLLYRSPVYERLKIETRNLFDVYWVAILGQVGLLGVVAYLWLLLSLLIAAHRLARAPAASSFDRGLRLGFLSAGLGLTAACFFGPSLSDRYLSLLFWLLAGWATVPGSESVEPNGGPIPEARQVNTMHTAPSAALRGPE
jgi:hypothetical protein